MQLSIVILNYKSKEMVKQCLKGIEMFDHGLKYEIIVVDNNSNDQIEEMLKQSFPQVKFIQAKANKGYGSGNNLGIKASQGKYVMVINPDVIVFEDSIKNLVDFMEKNTQVGLAGPKLLNPDKSVQLSCCRFHSFGIPVLRRTPLGNLKLFQPRIDHFLMKDFDHAQNRAVDWIMGSCLIAKKQDWEKVDYFDERYFMYFEDTDLSRKFWENNLQVYYVADAQMVHYHHRESSGNSWFLSLFNKMTRIHITSWIKYFWKHRGQEIAAGSEL